VKTKQIYETEHMRPHAHNCNCYLFYYIN